MLNAAGLHRGRRRGSILPLRLVAAGLALLLVPALSSAAHRVSTPPDLAAAAALSWNSGTGDLSWYYTHPGDYNQDGLVTVSDITPLGQNFGAEGPFAIDSALSVVDGNSDGLITVSDITPVGQNFGKQLAACQAYHSGSAADYPQSNTGENGGGATTLGTVQLADAPLSAGQRRRFVLALASPPATGFGWVRPLDDEGSPGTPSNMISFGTAGGNADPVAMLGADPTSGDAPLSVSFDASGSTDSDGQIVQYAWDFDSDTFTDLAGSAATVQHTYTAGGLYSASIAVLDDQGGQDSAQVQITVQGSGGQPPVAQLSAIPEQAAPGTEVVLHGGGSSDPEGGDLTYSFDPEGDGSFLPPDTDVSLNWTYTRLGEHQPALRVFDEDGQFDDAQASLEVTLGSLEKQVIDQQTGTVAAGNYVGLVIAGGRPGVAYYDSSAELGMTLRWVCAKDAAGSEWWDQRALGECDGHFSLGLAADHPCIAYVRGNDLHYIRADDPDGNGDWSLDRPIIDAAVHSDSGLLIYPSLSTVGGHPAVTCHNQDALVGGDLLYIRAGNSTGSVWPLAPRVVRYVEAEVAYGTALSEVADRPAVAYMTGIHTAPLIRFLRSSDESGLSWALSGTVRPSPVTAARTSRSGTCGRSAATARTGGRRWRSRPRRTCRPASTSRSSTACPQSPTAITPPGSADADGTEWNAPVLVDSGGLVGLSVKLAEIDGRAALAYYNQSRQDIEFAVYR